MAPNPNITTQHIPINHNDNSLLQFPNRRNNMSEYEVEYYVKANEEKGVIQLIKWEGEEKPILTVPLKQKETEGFTLESGTRQIKRCIRAIHEGVIK